MRADPGRAFTWLVLVLAGAFAAPSGASAYCRLTTSMAVAGKVCSTTGTPLYWPKQCINYSVSERAGLPPIAEIREVVDEAFATWTDSECNGHRLGMSVIQTDNPSMCAVPQYNDEEPNVNSIIFVEDWDDLPPEAFGLTLVWHREKSGVIVDADMQLNETLGKLDICGNTCPKGSVDLQNIITHEAGHFLGLGHSREVNACMYGKAQVGETSKRYLSRDDLDGICAIYGALAEPKCKESDFIPDNGQATECLNVSGHQRTCACSVLGAKQERDYGALLALGTLASMVVIRARRRQRQR